MFRASHITSAFGGLLVGTLGSMDHPWTPVAFFAAGFFLVIGLPQFLEAMERREDRAARREIRLFGDWQRFEDDLRLIYVPVWLRMLTFIICAVIAAAAVKQL